MYARPLASSSAAVASLLVIGLSVVVISCSNDASDTDSLEDILDGSDSADSTVDSVDNPETDGDSRARTVHDGCVSHAYTGTYLVPGPCEDAFDASLEAKAFQFDRTWRTFNAAATGLNTDIGVSVEDSDDRALIEQFIQQHDGWDFEAFSGKSPLDVIDSHAKVAGLYAGVGIAADAFRYGVLRDQGYPSEEVDVAREHLLIGLEGLHRASEITGVEGVIARGLARRDLGGGSETVPLFDAEGQPLPTEKNNGTWRDDQSGLHPDYIWEDSCSRDMLLGWVTAIGASWEVIADDMSINEQVKRRLQTLARELGHALMTVRDDPAFCQGVDGCVTGYDLMIPDADGRRTLHGCLHEHDLDCKGVSELIDNGFNALMALGFIGTYAFVSGDEALAAYLEDELIEARGLHDAVAATLNFVTGSGDNQNPSGTNMAFGALFLAQRYIHHEAAQEVIREAATTSLYAIPGATDQPIEQAQSYFDFIYATGVGDPGVDGVLVDAPDFSAVERGLTTLAEFPSAPYWDMAKINCPEAQCDCPGGNCPSEDKKVAVNACIALDGTPLTVVGCYGWKGLLITEEVVPMRIRAPSNYHWRSSAYRPNGGGAGGSLLPAVDFRIAYWTGRWVKVTH